MAINLVIDFVQMPWSQSVVSWKHHGADVWDALEQILSADSKRVVRITGEASGNDRLSGTLEVSRHRFSVSVTVEGVEVDLSMQEAHIREYFRDMQVQLQASEHAVIMAVSGSLPQPENKPADFLLRTLWDLQLLSLRMMPPAGGELPSADTVYSHS